MEKNECFVRHSQHINSRNLHGCAHLLVTLVPWVWLSIPIKLHFLHSDLSLPVETDVECFSIGFKCSYCSIKAELELRCGFVCVVLVLLNIWAGNVPMHLHFIFCRDWNQLVTAASFTELRLLMKSLILEQMCTYFSVLTPMEDSSY